MKKNIILIQEEYGYRCWLGEMPDNTSLNDILLWYENLESVLGMFLNPQNGFPIPLTEIEDVEGDEDVKGDSAKLTVWSAENKKTYTLDKECVAALFHLHEDDDSYMKIVGGDYHYHKGYNG